MFRQANAKLKSELAVTAANKARADAELARQTAAKCEDTPLKLGQFEEHFCRSISATAY